MAKFAVGGKGIGKALLHVLLAVCICTSSLPVYGQIPAYDAKFEPPNLDLISPDGWRRIDRSVEKALKWLVGQQKANGAFRTNGPHETAITSLAVMALLSAGHTPGEGPFGESIDAGIDFVLSCQQSSGQISSSPTHSHSTYHHAIAGVMLGECYGMTDRFRSERIARAIRKALSWTERLQYQGGGLRPMDKGGWRYTTPRESVPCKADLSVTSWMVMFYRSARNAAFEVPEDSLGEALQFVRRCYIPAVGGFRYCPPPKDHRFRRCNWAMTGAGVVTLALAGEANDPLAVAGGKWLIAHPMTRYGQVQRFGDRYHYAAYYSSLATFQLGGKYWRAFYPRVSQQLLGAQLRTGQWPLETGEDQPVANVYSTSMAVMTLTVPFQILPIYQR